MRGKEWLLTPEGEGVQGEGGGEIGFERLCS